MFEKFGDKWLVSGLVAYHKIISGFKKYNQELIREGSSVQPCLAKEHCRERGSKIKACASRIIGIDRLDKNWRI
ncbi:MAG: hypothetical protein WD555_02215 [Fulvivirga sp.]